MKRYSYTLLQQRVWRWHFFAGLMVVPFAIILSVTGALYLFKPQFNGYIEDSIHQKALTASDKTKSGTTKSDITNSKMLIPAEQLVDRVLSQYEGSTFKSYTLAERNSIAVKIDIIDNQVRKTIWVNQYNGEILHAVEREQRFMNMMSNIHGQLFAGKIGSYVVELMASWMIVLIISGIFLWWPRKVERAENPNTAIKRTFLLTKAKLNKRNFWLSLHGVTGIWICGFVLLLLLSGLPWTSVWGGAFKKVQDHMSWGGPGQEWFVTLTSPSRANFSSIQPQDSQKQDTAPNEHAEHISSALSHSESNISNSHTTQFSDNEIVDPIPLSQVIEGLASYALLPPVEIHPPRIENGVWTVRSMVQNRPLRETHHFDKWTGEKVMSIYFSDYHPVKQLTAYGIAMHEGALFGWFNQLLGLIAALGVILLSVTGTYLWWKRRPKGKLAAPSIPAHPHMRPAVIISIVGLAVFLPLFAASVIIILLFDSSYTLFSTRFTRQVSE